MNYRYLFSKTFSQLRAGPSHPIPSPLTPTINRSLRSLIRPASTRQNIKTCPAPWEAGCRMARVYADVNQQMPRAYWDYDSVNITWGVLENYEVVRKIGELSFQNTITTNRSIILTDLPYRTRKVLGGLWRNQCCQLPKVCYQGSEAGQEEEDKERNQDPTKSLRGTQHCRTPRRGSGQSSKSLSFSKSFRGHTQSWRRQDRQWWIRPFRWRNRRLIHDAEQNAFPHFRIRQQHRFPKSVPQVCWLRCPILHLRVAQGSVIGFWLWENWLLIIVRPSTSATAKASCTEMSSLTMSWLTTKTER